MNIYEHRLLELQKQYAADISASLLHTIAFPAKFEFDKSFRAPAYKWCSDCATFHPVESDCIMRGEKCTR